MSPQRREYMILPQTNHQFPHTKKAKKNPITEMTNDNRVGEIEEEEEQEATPLLQKDSSNSEPPILTQRTRSVRTKVPEAEVNVYKQGKGPIDVIRVSLGGWDQNQLEVREILDKYGFKSVYALTPGSGRGVPIRFSPKNGRSLFTYSDGAVIHVDGEPKDSMLLPITRILLGVVFLTIMIIFFMKETPQWAKKFNFSTGGIPPWVLACAVVVFLRMRKRTKSFLENRLR